MPRNEISVFVIDAPPPDQPVLWTAEVEAAILAKQGTVVKRALKVTPWKDPNGSWAKAVDTDGNHWIGCRSKGRDVWNKWRTKASMGEAYYETGPGKRTKAVMGDEAYNETGKGKRTKAVMGEEAYNETGKGKRTKAAMGEEAYYETGPGKRTKAAMGEEAYYETGPGKRTKAVMGEEAYYETGPGKRVKAMTKAVMGEEAYYETGPGKRTKAVMGEEAFRATGRGQRNATESARLVAARGEGETPDGLTAEEREALASRVAMEVCAVVNEWLTSDSKASAYIAIGTWERMVSNLIAAQESGWMNLARCEIFASLLRTNPSAFVLVNGQAQRFTTALIREGLQKGYIKYSVCGTRMYSSYAAKLSEVEAHTCTMARWGRRMLMKGVSFGGPAQNHAGGHALGGLLLGGGGDGASRYLVPNVTMSVQPATEALVFQASSRRVAGIRGLEREREAVSEAAASSSTAAPSEWHSRLVCTAINPTKPSSLHNKHWSVRYTDEDATLTFTWGSLAQTNHTQQVIMSFGAGHEAIASAYGKKRRDAKLRGTKTKAAYRELDDNEAMELPSVPCLEKATLKLSDAECLDREPDTLDDLFEPESEDEDEDAVDEIDVAEFFL